MRFITVLYMMLVLTPVVGSARQESRLEGCVDPQIIAKVLGEMRQENSRPISLEQFRAMWPVELVDVEVNPPANSRTLQSADRILRGQYQCSEVFLFNVRPEGGATLLELQSVIVNYSARSRGTLVTMAKLFAQSVGLKASDLKTIGSGSSQDYQWEKIKGEERRLYGIELRFTREAGLWKMFFSTGFYVVKP
jgi:hypothetical protein